jgi:mono/diheme cytochrome c family protein
MNRLRAAVSHPFARVVLILVGAYVVFTAGIRWIPPLFGVASAPVPSSVVLMYMAIAAVGALIYASDEEERWTRFKEPVHRTLVDDDKRWLRRALFVALPLLVGFVAYDQTRPKVEAPIEARSIHPANPTEITFRGTTMKLAGTENPLRTTGDLAAHYETGKRVYYQNCLPCHGDRLDGEGHFGHGFSPTPLAFNDPGTIAQLTESYVFWRVAKGGPGLPREGTPWNSAMPVWENYLTADEIWSVIIFLYEQSGRRPRTWEASAAEGAKHE